MPEPAPALEEPEVGESPPPVVAATDLESLHAVWPAVVELVGTENNLFGALIADARPAAVEGEDLTVAFASSAAFLKKKAEHPDNRAIVSEALRQLSGGRWRLSYELLEADAEPRPSGRRRRRRSGCGASWRSSTPRSCSSDQEAGRVRP